MRKICKTICLYVFGFAACAAAGSAAAREQVQIAGSSTVLPYARIVADAFGNLYPQYKIPVIESGGSGGGIKEFCRGVGEETIDIAESSRPIKPSELALCAQNGVNAVQELRIGYDGLVLSVGRKKDKTVLSAASLNIAPQDIYHALAAQVFIDGRLQPNPYKTWNAVNKTLPNTELYAYIPGEKHGTREIFEEKLLLQGCRDSGAYQHLLAMGMTDAAAQNMCIAVRTDGRAVDIEGDYSETLAQLVSNPNALGVFGLSFYQNNADKLQALAVNGVFPSAETIAAGQYKVVRPLFMYVKKLHIGLVPGMEDYISFFLSEPMIGADGALAEYGLVPESESARKAQRAAFAAGVVLPVLRGEFSAEQLSEMPEAHDRMRAP